MATQSSQKGRMATQSLQKGRVGQIPAQSSSRSVCYPKRNIGCPNHFLKNLVIIVQVWFCCSCSSSIKERNEERGGSAKAKEDNGTEAHERLRIFRGRAQLSKGVSSPALDLYPTPSYRVKKGKGSEIEVKNIRRLEKRGGDVRLKKP